ncbi:MAG: hypothetical protein ACKOQ9_05990, partial [Verrucomicrobiota bacterium]
RWLIEEAPELLSPGFRDGGDVDEASLGDKVWKPLASRLTGLAVRVGVDAAVDRAREQVLRAAESLLSR